MRRKVIQVSMQKYGISLQRVSSRITYDKVEIEANSPFLVVAGSRIADTSRRI